VGHNAGDGIVESSASGGDQMTMIGSGTDPSTAAGTNQTAIGYGATGQANNSVTLGNASVTAVYMAQDSGATVHCSALYGEITNSVQPAFLVKPSSAQTDLAIDTSVTIVFGTEVFDQGGDFASSAFTAPVTGKYQFNASILLSATVDADAVYYQLELVASNRTIYSLIDPDFGQDAAYWTLNLSVLVDMDASDTVVLKMRQAGGAQQVDIHAISSWSGYLVC